MPFFRLSALRILWWKTNQLKILILSLVGNFQLNFSNLEIIPPYFRKLQQSFTENKYDLPYFYPVAQWWHKSLSSNLRLWKSSIALVLVVHEREFDEPLRCNISLTKMSRPNVEWNKHGNNLFNGSYATHVSCQKAIWSLLQPEIWNIKQIENIPLWHSSKPPMLWVVRLVATEINLE